MSETHISTVFLVGDRAYKVKKPVRFPFVDLSTPERRGDVCRREVELNRRMAPDVYLGVADIVGPAGEVCDHLVVMRRMPDERRLSTLVTSGAVLDDDITEIARRVATFHAGAARGDRIDAAATRDAIRARWESGFREIEPFVGSVLDADTESDIEDLARRYLEGRGPLFEERIRTGRIVDGHGDLLADDVFVLDDGPRILDCLEFDDDLRYGDVLADVAFLAMDLERLGAQPVAAQFLAAYRELSGDTDRSSLQHHYIALRAHIRAKVACLRGDDVSQAEARQLVELARVHLRAGKVVLALVGGDPGAGKSTLAIDISDRLGWSVLRSDEVRKDLAGVGHQEHTASEIGAGFYSDAATDATYDELLDRAEVLLALGESVVLDATRGDARQRARARALAAATTSDLVELRCAAPAAVREDRIRRRVAHGADASDATVEVARAVSEQFDPWPTASVIDTGSHREGSLDRALHVTGADLP